MQKIPLRKTHTTTQTNTTWQIKQLINRYIKTQKTHKNKVQKRIRGNMKVPPLYGQWQMSRGGEVTLCIFRIQVVSHSIDNLPIHWGRSTVLKLRKKTGFIVCKAQQVPCFQEPSLVCVKVSNYKVMSLCQSWYCED